MTELMNNYVENEETEADVLSLEVSGVDVGERIDRFVTSGADISI